MGVVVPELVVPARGGLQRVGGVRIGNPGLVPGNLGSSKALLFKELWRKMASGLLFGERGIIISVVGRTLRSAKCLGGGAKSDIT